jgi:hypothetical protein
MGEFYEGTVACWRPIMCVYLLHFYNMRKKLETVPGDICQ